jgi:predicted dehydrogenase
VSDRPLRVIQVGTGGFGGNWCREYLPHVVRLGKAEVVAAVDLVPGHLANARASLGLGEDRCYTDLGRALSERAADAVVVVVPPAHHEAVIDAALARGLHVLCEKPIADSMAACCRIARKVRDAGVRMAVTMSHRFDQDKQTLEAEIRSGRHGRLNYLVHRFTHNCRARGSWGDFRHRIPDPLLIEGTVHHFDIHRALAGADAERVHAVGWNPPWGEYAGDSTALITIEMRNGVKVLYEGAKANASTMNGWNHDYLRAECEHGTLELDRRALRVLRGDGWNAPAAEAVALREQPAWMNAWLAELFCDWIAGRRESHPTAIADNLQCAALLFAAIESARTRQPVDVQPFLARELGPGRSALAVA